MSRYREPHTIYIIVYNLKQNMQIYHILFNDNFFFCFNDIQKVWKQWKIWISTSYGTENVQTIFYFFQIFQTC